VLDREPKGLHRRAGSRGGPPTPRQSVDPGGGLILQPQAERDVSSLFTDLTPGSRCRFNARHGTVERMRNRAGVLGSAQYWTSLYAERTEFAHSRPRAQEFLGLLATDG
jgi:hypothetical protein